MKKLLILTLFSGILSTNSFAITTLWNRTSIPLVINGTRVENRGSIEIDETTNATIACYYYGESREPLFFTFNSSTFSADQHYHVYVQRSLSNRALGDQKLMQHIQANTEDGCSATFSNDFLSHDDASLLRLYCIVDDEEITASNTASDKIYAEETIPLSSTFNFPYYSLSSSILLESRNENHNFYLAKIPYLNPKKSTDKLISHNIIQINCETNYSESLSMPLVKGIVDWVEAGNTIRQRIYKPDETHNLPLEAILANIRHGYLERIIYHDEYGRQIKLDGNATPTNYSGYYLQINIPGCLYNLKNNCSSKGCACSTNNGYYGHAGEYEIGIAFGKINGEISNALYVSHFFFRIPKKKTIYFWHPDSEEMSSSITNWTSENHAMIPSPYKSKTMFHNSPAASTTTSLILKNATPYIDQLNQEKFMQTLFATREYTLKKRSSDDLISDDFISEETNLDDDYSMKPSELATTSKNTIKSSQKKSKRYTDSTASEGNTEENNEDFLIFSINEELTEEFTLGKK